MLTPVAGVSILRHAFPELENHRWILTTSCLTFCGSLPIILHSLLVSSRHEEATLMLFGNGLIRHELSFELGTLYTCSYAFSRKEDGAHFVQVAKSVNGDISIRESRKKFGGAQIYTVETNWHNAIVIISEIINRSSLIIREKLLASRRGYFFDNKLQVMRGGSLFEGLQLICDWTPGTRLIVALPDVGEGLQCVSVTLHEDGHCALVLKRKSEGAISIEELIESCAITL